MGPVFADRDRALRRGADGEIVTCAAVRVPHPPSHAACHAQTLVNETSGGCVYAPIALTGVIAAAAALCAWVMRDSEYHATRQARRWGSQAATR